MTHFISRLNHVIYVAPRADSTDGDATYGTPVAHPCHIEHGVSRILNTRGEEVTSIATVYLEAEVTAQDKFILPDALGNPTGVSRTPVKVMRITNPRKGGTFHHCEVML